MRLSVEWHQFLEKGLPLGNKPASMTIGIFDGVHLGHQALIKRIVSYNADYVPVVVTFRQNYKTEARDIQTFQQRLDMLEKLGVQITIVVDFTDEFRQMPGFEFLEILFKHGNIGFFAAGSDFRCGHGLDTDASAIQRFFASRGIPAEIVPQVMEGSIPVSSSRIRAAISAGDHSLAQVMLGDRND
ncbi:MAG: FAD synthetase family protein [Treponema sp.]|nr:FAD synthetase family protein [Treponema sp.]